MSFENLSLTGILPTTPIVTPTNLSGNYATSPDRVELSWDDMSTAGYLLIARDGADVNWAPTNGQSYGTGSQGANEIVYVGSLQTATHSGITAGNTYHYALYAYNANHFYSATPVTFALGAIDCSGLDGGAWVAVPGDSDYGTDAFCVMKYEAKDVGGVATSQAASTPWVSITRTNAKNACIALGYDMITNQQWLTITSNVASVGSNWSGGSIGSGSLNRGHSDSSPNNLLAASADDNDACFGTGQTCDALTWDLQRRTFELNTGEVIWDLSGNAWNFVFRTVAQTGKATPANASWYDYPSVGDGTTVTKSELVPTVKSWWNSSWNSSQGIGRYSGGTEGSGGALIRGGPFDRGSEVGLFAAGMYINWYSGFGTVGFRCAATPP